MRRVSIWTSSRFIHPFCRVFSANFNLVTRLVCILFFCLVSRTDARALSNSDNSHLSAATVEEETVKSRDFQEQWILPRRKWHFVANYLYNYGYTDSLLAEDATKELREGLRQFGKDIGYTGRRLKYKKLLKVMQEPRCSLKNDKFSSRIKRYITNSQKWTFTDLSWKFSDPYILFKRPRDFDVVRSTIEHALDMWSRASNRVLRFEDLTDVNETAADISIFFARGDHGDHEPFDGKGGIVAHSGYPMEGRIHFDASELWTINGERGIDLRYVTLHELGHALGLRHSRHKNAVMHPIYHRIPKEIALSSDDIKGMRHLYDTPILKPN